MIRPPIGWLRREAEVAQCVSHPNLVSVLSASLQRPPYYIVTPYLPGEMVSTLATRTLGLPRVLWIVRQIAQALAALHGGGWIHNDVRPQKVRVSHDGHATLMDLGRAMPRQTRCERQLAHRDAIDYAAPESFTTTRYLDAASDVYSLGVTLFELLTGRRPFQDELASGLVIAHLRHQPPEIRRFAPQLPARLSRLVRRMLAKEPLRRPETEDVVQILVELEIETFDHWDAA